jgi:4,5-DOPA dioxygenase extradiol
MDTFFIAHGAVTLAVDETIPVRSFLQSWKSDTMQEAPTAILMVSGHWDTDAPTVNLVKGENETIHDFNGFPGFFYEDFINNIQQNQLIAKIGSAQVSCTWCT